MRRPQWSLVTNFWVAVVIVAVLAFLLMFYMKKPVWVELETLAAVTGVAIFGFYFYLLYNGVQFSQSEELSVMEPGSFPLKSGWDFLNLPFDATWDLSLDDGIVGLFFGLVASIAMVIVMAIVLLVLVWAGVGLFWLSVLLVGVPLFYIFKQSVFFVMAHAEECYGNFWRSLQYSFGYAAFKTAVLCLIVFVSHQLAVFVRGSI